MKIKSITLAAVLGALVMVGSAGVAQASGPDPYRDDACARKIYNEERALDRAIERHGNNSRQADHARWDLQKTREVCGHPR
jgi:hypothetical protein